MTQENADIKNFVRTFPGACRYVTVTVPAYPRKTEDGVHSFRQIGLVRSLLIKEGTSGKREEETEEDGLFSLRSLLWLSELSNSYFYYTF